MSEMKIVMLGINEIEPYENNPRLNDGAVEYVANSIREFGFKQPIVVDANHVIIAGHTRWKAAKALGLKKVPAIVASDLTEEQARAYRLADNKVSEAAMWDFEALDRELEAILDIDMGEFGFFDEEYIDFEEPDTPEGPVHRLTDAFIVPPFSVLDTRQGYWQDRKRAWLEKTGDLSETRNGDFGRFGDGMLTSINDGTSNFDPVLAEVMYHWFSLPGCKILDPFGGEQTKGVVAGEMGYEYHAVEIRQEQVDLNREKTKAYPKVNYYCGDSNDISAIIPERGFNLLFTSPPYYDLEVYSKEDLSALGTYEDFMAAYRNIFRQCYDMMEDGSFAIVKVAEIRDKKTGIYRSFVADNIRLFTDIGFHYYNDIVLVNAVGTAQIRARRMMANRKVVKLHQNVLVFYKGDVDGISKKYPELTDWDEVEDADLPA